MKKIILLVLFPITIFGQNLNINENGYYDTIEFKGLSKIQIYERASAWVIGNYSTIYDFIQSNTADEIIARGNFRVSHENYVQNFEHTLSLTFNEHHITMEIVLNSLYNERAKKMQSIRYGYLSSDKQKIYDRLMIVSQQVAKETIIEKSMERGESKEEAEASYLKLEHEVLARLPKSPDDIDYQEFAKYNELIRTRVGDIFLSLVNYLNKDTINE